MGEGSRGCSMVEKVVFCLFLVQQLKMGYATIYNVGDELGWTFNVSSWPIGKNFHAGDILAFNYTPSTHNVVEVDKVGYNWCLINPIEATVHHSGKDQMKLVEGMNYYICSLPGHCQMGMKLAINATSSS
ncbi:basic blue protein-like [Cucumis melo var. makuwa]|uniref:Basic blue protein n=3 Tax=Cucumis melo TaxID=3656 RepID=A0A5A7TAK8_CUCMM|nr:basic blue protein-like [Cucumis melo]KAA0039076.1 basic blue protein-like [Cucumis melo var. makuwa]TYJ99729.1 basic blue protein-like [Cucumis melo var. makuwa]